MFMGESNRNKGAWGRVLALAAWVALAVPVVCLGQDSSGWLLTQSQPDGSISASSDPATVTQSTSEAIRSLRLVSGTAPVGAAESFVLAQSYRATEHVARSTIVKVDRGESAALLAAELLTHQNADGGYGEFAGYQSTPLDTAFALTALVRAGQFTTTQNLAALNYLIATQGSSGGWSIGANEPSIYVTAHALEALWQDRKSVV